MASVFSCAVWTILRPSGRWIAAKPLASLHQKPEVAKRIQLSIVPTGFPVSPSCRRNHPHHVVPARQEKARGRPW